MKTYKGSVTIYMLLTLLLVTALVCTVTESARVHALNAHLRNVSYMAADSTFADYAGEVFDDYGIMMLWKTPAQFLADYNSFLRKNLDLTDLNLYRDADLYLARHEGSALLAAERITDANGERFLDQVDAYMNYFLLEETVLALLDHLGICQAGSVAAAFLEKIGSLQDVFLRAVSIINRIQSAADQAKSIVYNPGTLLGNMKQSLNRFRETGQNVYVAQFNTNYWNLQSGYRELAWHLDTIRTESANYEVCAQETRQAALELGEELQLQEEAYTEDAVQAIRQQIEDLQLRIADSNEADEIRENGQLAGTYKEQIDTLALLEAAIGDGVNPDTVESCAALTEEFAAAFENMDLGSLGLSSAAQRVQREDSGFLKTIQTIFSKGLLAAVTDGEISGNRVDTKEFPSRTETYAAVSDFGSPFRASYRKLVCGEYLLTHFGNYLDTKEETALQYEAEYVLGGKASDEDNLKTVVREMVLLREGLNMTSMMKDPEKMADAQMLALGIVGFTGLDILIDLVKWAVISAWCLAESLCDVKTLLKGGRIPVIKAPHEWTVTRPGLKNIGKSLLPSAYDQNGLSYTDYLRLLLLQEKDTVMAFRMMDLIQANMCKNHQPAFRVKNCLCRVQVQVQFQARQLFSAFPFVRSIAGNGDFGYRFSFHQEYAY